MKITLNNNEEIFDCSELTVSGMLELKRYSFKLRIIKVNGKLVRKEEYDTTIIREGDNVQMLYLMSGG
jgi:thiamine biosynthesis protein ThiS